jgi:hypothetical protein
MQPDHGSLWSYHPTRGNTVYREGKVVSEPIGKLVKPAHRESSVTSGR